ncbi:hypothetical protein HYALB_00010294 [Hymenoscyphus albidus]|uniref:Uncharacterized protein n=1 Tax=Hymenoscyphus albidus TaxID=595503 RepID=A0A9N9LSD9_9HELO|nr:hypothetical protein HYALB_00010294 [Hymenoscyphus albidus]
MVDTVSIILAVVSLVGSLISAGFTGWVSFYIDQVKRRSEAKALIHKYRDPLTLAAFDLQSRLYGLVQLDLLHYHEDEEKKNLIYLYSAFLVGQYLSWTYILRRQGQFLNLSTDKSNNLNKRLDEVLSTITNEFSLDNRQGENPWMLWRGQQMAIGELMTKEEQGQLYCMGFAAFAHRYNTEPEFKHWFHSIEDGISMLVDARAKQNRIATYRLRRVQHLLIDLVNLLDPVRLQSSANKQHKVDPAHECLCSGCPSRKQDYLVSKAPKLAV